MSFVSCSFFLSNKAIYDELGLSNRETMKTEVGHINVCLEGDVFYFFRR